MPKKIRKSRKTTTRRRHTRRRNPMPETLGFLAAVNPANPRRGRRAGGGRSFTSYAKNTGKLMVPILGGIVIGGMTQTLLEKRGITGIKATALGTGAALLGGYLAGRVVKVPALQVGAAAAGALLVGRAVAKAIPSLGVTIGDHAAYEALTGPTVPISVLRAMESREMGAFTSDWRPRFGVGKASLALSSAEDAEDSDDGFGAYTQARPLMLDTGFTPLF